MPSMKHRLIGVCLAVNLAVQVLTAVTLVLVFR